MHPVGPLPPGAYWLRRLVALLALVAVVVLAWWAWGALTGGSDGGSSTPSLTTSPAPSTTSSAAPSDPASGTPTPTASPSPTATAKPTATAAAALCPSSAIAVAVTTDKKAYDAGQQPRITLSVTNTGSTACRRDVGQKALELQISAGGKRFWSSDDCAPGGSAALRLLGAGQSFRTTVVWQRTGSAPGCPSDRPAAPAGEYQVVGRDLDVTSEAAAFTLR